ncbi:MAG: hypothetical protein II971_05895 [Firmicutes bacterium]|nr:hypothetical protein [Bacillota bacterium]
MVTISIKELLIYILLGCGIIAVVELAVLIRKLFPLIPELQKTLENVSEITSDAKDGTKQFKNAVGNAANTTSEVLGFVGKNRSKLGAAASLVNATTSFMDFVGRKK